MQQNYGLAIAGGIQLEHQAMAAILHALKELLLLFVSRAGSAPNLQPPLGCSLLLVTALCGPPSKAALVVLGAAGTQPFQLLQPPQTHQKVLVQ